MKYVQASGKESLLSFGPYPEVSLEQARRKRDEARSQKAAGKDPGQVRRQEKAEQLASSKNSFGALAAEWLELARSKVSPKTMYIYEGIMRRNLLPALGDKHIREIRPADILVPLRELEKEDKTATCKKACQICSQVMQYAIASGVLEINPIPSLQILLRTRKVRRRSTILEPLQLGKLLLDIDGYGQRSGYFAVHFALQIMPYVFVRTSELINARWEQINFATCE
ncbi:MAG: integrase arm-type DNA-binding domain-containing protein [Desulfovibrio sp.]|nr:integrase arm-type DNA-binding domain-containing protein [Desulfovibrio sp.]